MVLEFQVALRCGNGASNSRHTCHWDWEPIRKLNRIRLLTSQGYTKRHHAMRSKVRAIHELQHPSANGVTEKVLAQEGSEEVCLTTLRLGKCSWNEQFVHANARPGVPQYSLLGRYRLGAAVLNCCQEHIDVAGRCARGGDKEVGSITSLV